MERIIALDIPATANFYPQRPVPVVVTKELLQAQLDKIANKVVDDLVVEILDQIVDKKLEDLFETDLYGTMVEFEVQSVNENEAELIVYVDWVCDLRDNADESLVEEIVVEALGRYFPILTFVVNPERPATTIDIEIVLR